MAEPWHLLLVDDETPLREAMREEDTVRRLTELGIEPPEIDVWAWAWDHDRLRETDPTDG